jgi:cysteinyl-tRNA synthetase
MPTMQPSVAATIRVYNTLTRRKEPFQTVTPGQVGMYLCGPTVYREAHIGHMVGPVIFDAIKRYLVYSGYQVTWVVNITDVDDKLIAESQRRAVPMDQIAQEMTRDYMQNLQALGVDQIDHFPKATEHIDEIQRFIGELIDRGFAYQSDGDVYFEVARDSEYGKLSNRTMESLQGEGGEAAARKRAPGDFALWKAAKEGEPAWDSPWGRGRPGWHIECSAMSRKLLGQTFDIHGGGLDLIFPHHENEIAQSECCHGRPMVRYWMHNGLMKASAEAGKVGGRAERQQESAEQQAAGKISRSKGAGGLAELIRQQGGERLRFFLLRTHYRSTIVFDQTGLDEAGTALAAFYRYFERFQRITGLDFYQLDAPRRRDAAPAADKQSEFLQQVAHSRQQFLEKMDDDFNTGGAVSELFDLVRVLNRHCDRNQLEQVQVDSEARRELIQATVALRELSWILGLFVSRPTSDAADDQLAAGLIELLIDVRAQARKKKDFATSDFIRDRLAELGVVLEDRKDGTGWRREP